MNWPFLKICTSNLHLMLLKPLNFRTLAITIYHPNILWIPYPYKNEPGLPGLKHKLQGLFYFSLRWTAFLPIHPAFVLSPHRFFHSRKDRSNSLDQTSACIKSDFRIPFTVPSWSVDASGERWTKHQPNQCFFKLSRDLHLYQRKYFGLFEDIWRNTSQTGIFSTDSG